MIPWKTNLLPKNGCSSFCFEKPFRMELISKQHPLGTFGTFWTPRASTFHVQFLEISRGPRSKLGISRKITWTFFHVFTGLTVCTFQADWKLGVLDHAKISGNSIRRRHMKTWYVSNMFHDSAGCFELVGGLNPSEKY